MKKKNKIFALVLAVVFAATLAFGCGKNNGTSGGGDKTSESEEESVNNTIDKGDSKGEITMDNQNILAVVAGEEITQKDLDALIAALPKEQQAYAGNEHFRNQCLEQIITVHLFAKLGEELKLEETEAFADNLAQERDSCTDGSRRGYERYYCF